MRKVSLLLSVLMLAAMVLAACGGGATSTNVAGSPPPVTADATDDMAGTATESPTEEGVPTEMAETPGVPVTGDVNPARLSNQLDFNVWSQDGEQIGDVNDMILNLDDPRVVYVIVGTGGFLDLGEREILVPWNSLQLQTGTGDATGGQQNAFILQGDVEVFRNAPDFDLGNLPEMGQPAADWDVDVRTYWESGGTTGGTANTPAADVTETATVEATAEATEPAATEAGTGAGEAQDLQGVVLATEVLGSTINWGAQAQGTDQGLETATPDASAGAGQGTATPGATTETPAAAAPGLGTDPGSTSGTIEDMIVDVNTGDILYMVITAAFAEGERWIPVPLNLIQWNGGEGAFILTADGTVLQNAPSFADGQFPDTTTAGWNADIDTFWQNNGGS